MRKTVDILGVSIDSITMDDACEKINGFLEGGETRTVFTPNSEIIMAAQRDKTLKDILNSGDLVVADGAGVVLASSILGEKVPAKVSGIDIIRKLFADANPFVSFFLLGAKPGVAELAEQKLIQAHPGINIAGTHHGYFDEKEEDLIIAEINDSGANVLLVALGASKQEKWINENKSKLKAKVCIGVGGSLDVFAGKARLAPEFIRKAGFEWLYRLIKEPRRFKRMLDLPRFMFQILKAKYKRRR
ncbi:MAG: WecB/TagA/CpsF family glycosyltransferase [Eubacteriales bacterium]|nr:WecB/TagA/CpsF family glycosyltransferase [Eubacteriales bacterium]